MKMAWHVLLKLFLLLVIAGATAWGVLALQFQAQAGAGRMVAMAL